ncbi:MAG: protoglobin family protein [Gemmataceae bacterium]
MTHVDEEQLERDPEYRFRYLADFIGFSAADQSAVQMAAMYVGPMIPQLVDTTYQRLLAYDATARHFMPQQHGYEGPLPTRLDELAGSAQIRFRKEHLGRYFMQILGRSFDSKFVAYLDMVGKMHTTKAGNPNIHVPLVQMNALMGLLADILAEAIGQMPLSATEKLAVSRAFQKLLWIQNDFITRHYAEGKA